MFRWFILLVVACFSGCSSVTPQTNATGVLDCEPIRFESVSIAGQQPLPNALPWGRLNLVTLVSAPILQGTEVTLDEGPVLISQSGSHTLVYRVMTQEEISFTDSDKTPKAFLIDSLQNPKGFECAFADGVRGASTKRYVEMNGFGLYLFSESDGLRAYAVTEGLDLVIEILAKGFSEESFDAILSNMEIEKI